jgi:hypothetical protein
MSARFVGDEAAEVGRVGVGEDEAAEVLDRQHRPLQDKETEPAAARLARVGGAVVEGEGALDRRAAQRDVGRHRPQVDVSSAPTFSST